MSQLSDFQTPSPNSSLESYFDGALPPVEDIFNPPETPKESPIPKPAPPKKSTLKSLSQKGEKP